MGQSKQKKEKFLREHPFCCFCGGVTPATTIDHVPARVCFWERAYPETFEFPACESCQNASRLDELAFGFFAHMVEHNPKNFDAKNIDRLITGMANNLPHLLPNPYLGGREKRKLLGELGLKKPADMFSSEIPLATIDPAAHAYILRYTRKIGCALFYREQGRVAGKDYKIWAYWQQSSLPKAQEILGEFLKITPLLVKGTRSNLDFGDRFAYRCNKADDPDVFAALAQFGRGMAIVTLIAEPEFWAKLDMHDGWVTIGEMFR